MPVELHSTELGDANERKLLLLHGLMGSSRNWLMVARALSERFHVHVLDLRNHGQSPWADSMSWEALSSDLEHYTERAFSGRPFCLLGHSLGGKCAMHFATHYPKQVEKLVVVDIAAKRYPPHFKKEFEALLRLPISKLKNRQEGFEFLEAAIPDRLFRESLLANLKRNVEGSGGGFIWQPNLQVLYDQLEVIRTNPLKEEDAFLKAVLLVQGEQSEFIQSTDHSQMRSHFPQLNFQCIKGAGHNPHIDQKEALVELLMNWL